MTLGLQIRSNKRVFSVRRQLSEDIKHFKHSKAYSMSFNALASYTDPLENWQILINAHLGL